MNLIWLRNDLRLDDNPALHFGAKESTVNGQKGCFCVYIMTPKQWQDHCDAPAKIAFWRQRLIYLQKELNSKNIPLKILKVAHYTHIPKALLTLAKSTQTHTVFFNAEYPLNEKHRDEQVISTLNANNIASQTFHGDVIAPPGTVKTQQNTPYKVFTPFCRRWHQMINDDQLTPLAEPNNQAAMPFPSDSVDKLWPVASKNTSEHTSKGQALYREDIWPTDTAHIHQQLAQFCLHKTPDYKEQRDLPAVKGTSLLSPYLAIGAVSVRQCIASVREHLPHWRENQWVTELIWREFYRHLIDEYPHISQSKNFIHLPAEIPWENDPELFKTWCTGKTGFPIVDAAMRQLVQTGWMHNRLRMITAAFLTKLLFIDWRWGEQFFMQHLLDGDFASNNGGWQWAASTGADAAPYFRIFNPQRQSERFDKNGLFIKKLLPELANLDSKSIHNPSSEQRALCQYPEPIIDYSFARQRALDSYAKIMKSR